MMNIYNLGDNEGKGSIRAVFNPKLKKEINNVIYSLKTYGFFRDFCKNTKTDYKTLWKYLNKHNYVPLYILEELEKLSGSNIQEDIHYLEYGAGSTKRSAKVAEFSEDLASMVGAFIEDGHLKQRDLRNYILKCRGLKNA